MYQILITGGAGYIGSALLPLLSQLPQISKIIIYDNLSHGRREAFLQPPFTNAEKIHFLFGELLDSRNLQKVLEGIDYVIHLAAKVSTPFANGDAHSFEQINHWGTAELSYAVESRNLKGLLYVSSASVYGSQNSNTPEICTIDTAPSPSTWYGQSKLRGEKMLSRLQNRYPISILRCANVYGLAPCVRFDAVINRFAFEAHFQRRLMIEGTGKQMRPFVHIDNLVQSITHIVDETLNGAPQWNGIFNVVQHNRSIVDIADALKEIYLDLEMIFVEQDMPRHSLLVETDPNINMFFNKRTFDEELKELLKDFAF